MGGGVSYASSQDPSEGGTQVRYKDMDLHTYRKKGSLIVFDARGSEKSCAAIRFDLRPHPRKPNTVFRLVFDLWWATDEERKESGWQNDFIFHC